MPSYCHVTIAGHLARDPEIRHLANEKAVANFSICYNRGYGDNKKAVFVECSAWDKAAEYLCKYHQKGSAVLIAGHLELDEWEDKNTGQKRSRLKLVAREIQGLSSKSERSEPLQQTSQRKPAARHEPAADTYDDDPPF